MLEAFCVWLGASWLRAIEVPLNTGYRGQMLAYVANHSEAKVAVVSERYVDRLERVAEQLVHLERVIVPDAVSSLPALPFEVHSGTILHADGRTAQIGPLQGRYRFGRRTSARTHGPAFQPAFGDGRPASLGVMPVDIGGRRRPPSRLPVVWSLVWQPGR